MRTPLGDMAFYHYDVTPVEQRAYRCPAIAVLLPCYAGFLHYYSSGISQRGKCKTCGSLS